MRGLSFFQRTNVQKSWNVISFHSRHSLTWSWILSFSVFRGDEARVRPLWYSYRDNQGLQWGFRIPYVGLVRWSRQQPMFYRDLCWREWERRDRETLARAHEGLAASQISELAQATSPSESLH